MPLHLSCLDSLTHIALGACIGEALEGKRLGKKSLWLGAIAQSLPDADFAASFWSTPAGNLLAHRGFTHSILFLLLIAPLLALAARRYLHKPSLPFRSWLLFFGVQVAVHLLIDGFNVYGIGWFEPFDHARITFNWIFVADPLYSIWPALAALALWILRTGHPSRRNWSRLGLIMSTVYLLYCGINKWIVHRAVEEDLRSQGIAYRDYFTTPAPLNSWLWYVVAATDSGYRVGYRSVFDKREERMQYRYVPKNDSLLDPLRDRADIRQLIRFSRGYYAAYRQNDTLVYNDLRFGDQIGWMHPAAPFVFYYYPGHPRANRMLIQRGRFTGWSGNALRSLWSRMRGH